MLAASGQQHASWVSGEWFGGGAEGASHLRVVPGLIKDKIFTLIGGFTRLSIAPIFNAYNFKLKDSVKPRGVSVR